MQIRHLIAAWVSLAVVVLTYVSRTESLLLRTDPSVVPTKPALMGFAQRRGEALYESHCMACHGARGRAYERGIPDLSDGDWLYGTGQLGDIEQVITYGIRSHHPKGWNLAFMPAYATAHPNPRDPNIRPLTPGNIRDLVEFLLFEQRTAARPVNSAEPMSAPAPASAAVSAAVVRGARLFGGAGGCYDCHAQDAKGDASIGAPNLTEPISLYGSDRDALWRSIAYGRAGSCPAWATRLSAADIREVAAFVYTLSRPARARATVVPAPAAPARTDTAPAVAAPMLTPKRGVA